MTMSVKELTEELFSRLGQYGYGVRVASVGHLADLQEEIEGRKRLGLIEEKLYQEYLAALSYRLPDNLLESRSLIVVAVPQPQIQVIFNWEVKSCPLIIPPTYLHYSNKKVEELLRVILEPKGYQVAPSVLPVKLLSARSGLSFYGKNNICYVPGMGSFHRLMAFYSDLPCEQDSWGESIMLEDCENCSACLNSCPTGAIDSNRFLLRAERCLTFLNESSGDFPEWINPTWHNCLVGCLHCQRACPQNADFLEWIQPGAEFSQEETNLLLQGVQLSQLPAATVKKLEQLDMVGYLEVLPRNLRVLLE